MSSRLCGPEQINWITEIVEAAGHIASFNAKFYPKLAAIEYFWGRAELSAQPLRLLTRDTSPRASCADRICVANSNSSLLCSRLMLHECLRSRQVQVVAC